jgi:hypothetical protein
MSEKLLMTTAGESKDWPEPVKRAFLTFCEIADQNRVSILTAVGINRAKHGEPDFGLTCFFSSRTSSNPHKVEMCEDIAHLFQKIAERFKQ